MSDEKIYPFMSRPLSIPFRNGYGESTSEHLIEIDCKKERCVAWGAKIENCPNCPEGDWVDGCRLIP